MDFLSQYYDEALVSARDSSNEQLVANLQAGGVSNLSVNQLRSALALADPDKPRVEINKYLARGCDCSVQDMLLMESQRDLYINVSTFKTNLKRGLLKKSSPSHEALMKIKGGSHAPSHIN